ncbi:LuxR family transcriptional regulator [Aestuariivivens sediminicola]|uniref:LuxR family transcriptional regulator n=1 Tax=Aestuariivivens sediminicola TaxID=2913560 RepID=UPI001F5A411D|nr:LuxR family transcriptional regulator [Aestuariivivens sediminicola]
MILYEREHDLNSLQQQFVAVTNGVGNTVLVTGEAGLGKSVLIKSFGEKVADQCRLLKGYCDPLFTPRPLGPLFDIADKIGYAFKELIKDSTQRSVIFSRLIEDFQNSDRPVVFIIEDIHWADEATLDLIKFLSRRISYANCLLILSYRNDEIGHNEKLEYTIKSFSTLKHTRINLENLSLEAIYQMTSGLSVSAHHIYAITKGHPFFVSEIIANDVNEIPADVSDMVLHNLKSLNGEEKELVQLLSLFPNPVDVQLMLKLKPESANGLEKLIRKRIIIEENSQFTFRHEIARLAIADAIPKFKQILYHSLVVDALKDNYDKSQLSFLVHHAYKSNRTELVSQLAPQAAEYASRWGAHDQAAKLYKIAIDCYDNLSDEVFVSLIRNYSFECYLTNQLDESISARKRILDILDKDTMPLEVGDTYRWLSRLCWFNGKNELAFEYAKLSIRYLGKNNKDTKELAQAYSNYGQLYYLKYDLKNAVLWCQKAIEMAKKLDDEEVLLHAYSNLGGLKLHISRTKDEAKKLLEKAMYLAKKVNNPDHIARIHAILFCNQIISRQYNEAEETLKTTIDFCDQNEIDSYYYYAQAWKAILQLRTSDWDAALFTAERVLKVPNQAKINVLMSIIPKATFFMRTGQNEAVELLKQAANLALSTGELQRIVPVVIVMLEYQWLYDFKFEDQRILTYDFKSNQDIYMPPWYESELAFWLVLNNREIGHNWKLLPQYKKAIQGQGDLLYSELMAQGCQYDAAIALVFGGEDQMRKAFTIFNELNVSATIRKWRTLMKAEGIKRIPKGLIKSTKSNPASLTNRQLDVLMEIGQGLHNAEIAKKLFISNRTVEHHVSAIFEKLEVTSRNKAVIKAKELGILK